MSIRLKLKRMWRKSKGRIHQINDVVAFLLMSLAYLIAVTPTAIIYKLINRDIIDRGLGDEESLSYWMTKMNEEQEIERVQRMY